MIRYLASQQEAMFPREALFPLRFNYQPRDGTVRSRCVPDGRHALPLAESIHYIAPEEPLRLQLIVLRA